MAKMLNSAAEILQLTMKSKDPVKDLLAEAVNLLDKGDAESLQQIDTILDGKLIEFVRNDLLGELSSFAYQLVVFLAGERGNKLKSTKEGKKLFDRWELLRDLCGIAVKDRDAQFTGRFIRSRKHGEYLVQLLYENREGMRPRELTKHLGISPQQLSKILREFESEDIIVREKLNGIIFVRIGFIGRVYMAKKITEISSDKPLTVKINTSELPRNTRIQLFDRYGGRKEAALSQIQAKVVRFAVSRPSIHKVAATISVPVSAPVRSGSKLQYESELAFCLPEKESRCFCGDGLTTLLNP